MALLAIEELIDINPWHGLRFGNLEPVAPAGIRRYFVADRFTMSRNPRTDLRFTRTANSCSLPTRRSKSGT